MRWAILLAIIEEMNSKLSVILQHGDPINYRKRSIQVLGKPVESCHIFVYPDRILFVFKNEIIVKKSFEPGTKWYYPISDKIAPLNPKKLLELIGEENDPRRTDDRTRKGKRRRS